MHQRRPRTERCQPGLGGRQRRRVGIDPEQPSIGSAGFEDRRRVPPAADRRIDVAAAGARRKPGNGLGEQHRHMLEC